MSLRSQRIATQLEAKRAFRAGKISRQEKRDIIKSVSPYAQRRARETNQELRGKMVEAQAEYESRQTELEARRQANVERGFISIDPRLRMPESQKERADTAAGQIALRRAVPTSNILARDIPKSEKVEIVRKDLNAKGESNELVSTRKVSGDLIAGPSVSESDGLLKQEASEKPEKYIPGQATKRVVEEFVVSPIRGVGKVLFNPFQKEDFKPQIELGQSKIFKTDSKLTDPDVQTASAYGALLLAPPIVQKVVVKGAVALEGIELLRKPSLTQLERTAATGALVFAPEVISKSKKVIVELPETTKALMADKSARVGGLSAKQRAGRISKPELRKQSFLAQRNPNMFFDKGELGVKVRNPELKTSQFVKERVVRFGAGESGAKVVEVKDVLLAGRGSLTTRLDTDISSQKFSQPGENKLFPKGFGSQSLSKVELAAKEQSLLGITIQRQRSFGEVAIQPKGVVLEKALPRQRAFKGGGEVETVEVRQSFPTVEAKFIEPVEVQRGGFRKGMREKLFQSLELKRMDLERSRFLSEPSKTELDVFQRIDIKPSTGLSDSAITSDVQGMRFVPLVDFKVKQNITDRQKNDLDIGLRPITLAMQAQSQDFDFSFSSPSSSPISDFTFKPPRTPANPKTPIPVIPIIPIVPYTPYKPSMPRQPRKPKGPLFPEEPLSNLPPLPPLKKGKDEYVQTYDVYVKTTPFKKEKYRKVNKKTLTYNQAFIQGIDIVDNYINQSFKLKKTNKKIKAPASDPYPNNDFKVRKNYRNSNVFTERRAYAIDTATEVANLDYFKQQKGRGNYDNMLF